jgi:nitrogen fixation protein NifU and related proteins
MDLELYQENVMDHYKHPRRKREMVQYSFKHHQENPLCGDECTIFVNVQGERVEDISFTGQGCAISQAATSLLVEFVHGKDMQEVAGLSQEKVKELLGVPISHTRIKCALLGYTALMKGQQQWREEQ